MPQSFSLFAEEVTDQTLCNPFGSQLNLAYVKDLQSAIEATTRFRRRRLPYEPFRKGYFLPIQTVLNLIGQNNGDISGLKIYFGESELAGKLYLDVIVVATNQVGTDAADDFNIPETFSAVQVVIGDGRPCPTACGKNNVLNTD